MALILKIIFFTPEQFTDMAGPAWKGIQEEVLESWEE
jgi:hypothetical protein